MADDGVNVIEIVVRATNATGTGLSQAQQAAKAAAAEQKALAKEVAAAQKQADAEAVAAKKTAMAEIKAQVESEAIAEKAAAAEAAAASRQAAASQRAVVEGMRSGGTSLIGKTDVAAALVVATALAVKSAATWQAQMVRLGTSANETGSVINNKLTGGLKQASDQLLQVSKDTATSTDEMANAAVMAESAGFHAASGLQQVMEAAAEGAKADKAPLMDMTMALTGMMSAYHETANQAVSATDQMVAAVSAGKMTMGAFASSLSVVLPVASAAGVKASEVFGAMATLTTSSSTSARKAAQEVAAAIKAFEAPNAVAAKTFTALGLSTNDLSMKLGQRGLLGSLNMVQAAIKAHTDSSGLVDLIIGGKKVTESPEAVLKSAMNGVVGMNAALGLGGANAKVYAENVAAIAAAAQNAGAHVKGWSDITGTMSFKFSQFINDVKIFGIQLGDELIPTLSNLGKIASEAFTGLGPIFGVAGLALTEFLKVVESLTGFIAAHQTVVEGFALIFGMSMAKNFLMGSEALASFTGFLRPAITGIEEFGAAYQAFGAKIAVTGTLEKAAAGFKNLAASMMTWSNTALVAVAAGVIVYQQGMAKINAAQDSADASVAKMTQGFNAFDTTNGQKMLDQLRAKAQAAVEEGKKYSGLMGSWELGFGALTGSNNGSQVAAGGLAAAKAYASLSAQMQNAKANVTSLSQATGLSSAMIESVATSAGVDLTQAFDSSGQARLKVIQDIQKMQDVTQTSAASIAADVGTDTAAVQAMTKALQDAQTQASQSFSKDFDVITGWQSSAATKASTSVSDAVTKAQEAVAAAQKKAGESASTATVHHTALTKAYSSHAPTAKAAATATDALAKAQERLAKAQENAAKVASKPGSGSLQDYYRQALAAASGFTSELNKAAEKGLDPELIGRLIAAGPTAAKPLLDAVAQDSTGSLVKMIDDSETKLKGFNAWAMEQARITAMVTGPGSSSQFSLDYSKASQIDQWFMSAAGNVNSAQLTALASKMHIPESEIMRIAKEFSIKLQAALDANPLKPPPVDEINSTGGGQYIGSTFVPAHASGGPAGGLTRINELGQEMVKLPSGSMVYPHANTVTHNESHPVNIGNVTVVAAQPSAFIDWSRTQAKFSAARAG